jgi:AraC-like DNA-binding protein
MAQPPAPTVRLQASAGARHRAGLHAEAIEAGLQAREWSAGGSRDAQLFLIQSGRSAMAAERDRIELPGPALAWAPGGRPLTIRLEAGARGHRLSVAGDVLAWAVGGLPDPGRLRRFLAEPATASAGRLAPYAEEIAQSFRALARELREPDGSSAGILAAHLALLSLHVTRLSETKGREKAAPERAGAVAQRFMRLVELHLRSNWSVKRYANALGVTEDRLRAACLRAYDRPPGEIIRNHLLAAARAQLEGSELPVEQIAFALGFRDASYFSRFCRKRLGASPGRYRRDFRARRAGPDLASFAAWP